jgi:tetratricopeptide (TPR) repeat protein
MTEGDGADRPSPTASQDIESALELRRRLEGHGTPETFPVSYLRICFGNRPMTSAQKARIAAALEAVGVESFPELGALSVRDQVHLEIVRPLTPLGSRGERARRVFKHARVRVVAPIVALLALAGSIASVLGLFSSSSPARAPIRRMSGDLNVAVAAFTTDGRVSPTGLTLAQAVANSLRKSLKYLDGSIAIEVRGPNAEPTGGPLSNPISSPIKARTIARQLEADIVVYGALNVTPDATTVLPTFFLNGTKLPSAAPVTGPYGYGPALHSALSIEISPQARAELRSALVARTTAYTNAFIGVGYYLRHSLRHAAQYLRAAARFAPSSSLALFDILLGNIDAQKGARQVALREYTRAEGDPALKTRAELGLGEVRYAKSHGQCRSPEIRVSGLDAARRSFVQAAQSAVREGTRASGLLLAKAQFGLGQVDLCTSSADIAPNWARVRAEFLDVVHRYTPSLVELRDDAAEAHAGIGLCDLSSEQPPASYTDAYHEYDAAARLTTRSNRSAYFYGAAAFAAEKLGTYTTASRDYHRAADLATSRGESRTYSDAATTNEHR